MRHLLISFAYGAVLAVSLAYFVSSIVVTYVQLTTLH